MRVLLSAASITAFAAAATAQIVPLQPLAQNIRRLETALVYLGQPFRPADQKAINEAIGNADEASAVKRLEQILEPYTLVNVEINPESRVKVEQGGANPELVEAGTRLFLVKVSNQAGVRAS